MRKMKLKILLTVIILFIIPSVINAAGGAAGGHRGGITSLVHNGDTILSCGEDGFLVIWNVNKKAASERFQLTTYGILAMAKHPFRNEICVIETNGMDYYRISAWNYAGKIKLFSLQSEEPVTYINYSAGGNLIIASGVNGSHLTVLDSVMGNIISAPAIPPGNASLAITGRAERNILIYQSMYDDYEQSFRQSGFSGQIIYVDVDSSAVTGLFQAPGNLNESIIFGNNRFLAGISYDGLVVIDAATGMVFDSIENITRSALLCSADDGFYCLNREGREQVLYRFSVDRQGNLVTREKHSISAGAAGQISSIAYNGSIAFASAGGNVLLIDPQNTIYPMAASFQTRITEIAQTGNSIAFLTENNKLFFLPLDYSLLQRNQNLPFTPHNGYTRITPLSPDASTDQFILWQNANTQYAPQIIHPDYSDSGFIINLSGRYPLRAISSKDDKILFLNASGNLSVYDRNNMSAGAAFTFSSIGAIDAIFTDSETMLLCRSVISGSSPLLFVNIKTGETVPVSYSAQAGIMSYAGNSGNIYASVVQRDIDGVKTKVLSLSNTGGTRVLYEYPGETHISVAEISGIPAVACGNEGAFIFAEEIIKLSRTEGLPEKLLGSEKFILCLDSEGNISWNDNKGKLLAVFRLFEDRWTLSGEREISGGFLQP